MPTRNVDDLESTEFAAHFGASKTPLVKHGSMFLSGTLRTTWLSTLKTWSRVWMLKLSPRRKFLKRDMSQNSCRSPRKVFRPSEPKHPLKLGLAAAVQFTFEKMGLEGGAKAAGLNSIRRARWSA